MSPKLNSLAIDEDKDHFQDYGVDEFYQPELKVLVNKRYCRNSITHQTEEVVKVEGRITISF